MDVLKPEVYWIGNRCYRVNPCQNSHQNFPLPDGDLIEDQAPAAAQLKPYVEADEFGDMQGDIDDGMDFPDLEILKEDNGFKVICAIPSSLYPQIIGSKGSVKKRIEVETRSRIYVPRPNEKGDIVVRGPTEADVRKGYKRLEQIALSSRFKRDPTHFACFAMNDPPIVQKAKELQEMVLETCSNSRGLEKRIFQEPEKLHLTISVMILLDERERKLAADILSGLEPEIRKMVSSKRIKIQLKGLEIMNDDPSQVNVLYAKCVPLENGPVQEIADLIARKFAEKQLGKDFKGEQVKLHCTIMNTRFRSDADNSAGTSERRPDDNRNRRHNCQSRDSFDARLILQKYGDYDFGTVDITQVKIATRHTTGSDGFYKCYSSLNI